MRAMACCRLPVSKCPSRQRTGELAVQLQKLRPPLVDQMIWHNEHRLLREIQTAEFHRGGGHGPSLARSHDMRQQWTTALEDTPDCVF